MAAFAAANSRARTGVDKIAVIYRDDSFGKDGVAGAERGFKPVFVEKQIASSRGRADVRRGSKPGKATR